MKITITLDEDVAAKVRAEMRRTAKSFKGTINDALRRGLPPHKPPQSRVPFRVRARDLGQLHPGLSPDDVAELLERVEGERRR